MKILEDSEQKEFVVSQGSEFARVGRKGIIFKVKLLILRLFSLDSYRVVFLTAPPPLKVLSVRLHGKSHQKVQKVSEFTYRLALLKGAS